MCGESGRAVFVLEKIVECACALRCFCVGRFGERRRFDARDYFFFCDKVRGTHESTRGFGRSAILLAIVIVADSILWRPQTCSTAI